MARGPAAFSHAIFVCTGGDCSDAGSRRIARRVEKALKERGLRKKARVFRMKCTGYCKLAPVIAIQPEGCWLMRERPADAVARVLAVVDPEAEG